VKVIFNNIIPIGASLIDTI